MPGNFATDEQLLVQYQQDLERQDRAAGTVRGYIADLQLFARWLEQSVGEPFAPDKVVSLDVRSYRGYLQTIKGLSPATINRRLQSLRTFFRWARGQKLVGEDPTEGVGTVPTTRKQFAPKALEGRLANRMLRAAQQSRYAARDYALLQVMLQAGLRVSEVAGLQVEDLELGERSGRARVRSGKGGKERSVPLNATVRKALRDYLKKRPALAGVTQVFVSQKGKGMSSRAIERVVRDCARLADLGDEEITAHSLRHTFATNYLERNPGQLVELAALLGHASLNTTAIYTQPSFEDVSRKLEDLETNTDR